MAVKKTVPKNVLYYVVTSLFVAISLGYIVFAYSKLGWILWEIAPRFSLFLFLPVSIIVIFKIIKSKRENKRLSKKLVVVFLVSMLFMAWSYYPVVTISPQINEFQKYFVEQFGDDYQDVFPANLTSRLSSTPFSFSKLLLAKMPAQDYYLKENVMYGNDSWQYLDIYLPVSPVIRPMPCLIIIHGGALISSLTAKNKAAINTARYFTAQGMAVVSIEYRKPPRVSILGMLHDVRSAIAWLHNHANNYNLDPDNFFILGRSRGGQLGTLAAYSVNTNNSVYQILAGNYSSSELKVKGVIDLYGSVNPFLSTNEKLEVYNLNKKVYNASFEEDPGLYYNTSASLLVNSNSPPTLIIHGKMDRSVPLHESEHLYKTLKNNRVLSIFLVFSTATHAFDAYPWTANTQVMLYFVERFIWTLVFGNY